MEPWVVYYLIAVNLLGLLFAGLNKFLRTRTSARIGLLVGIVALLGGSVGAFIGILLFDRKAEKDNMMLYVFMICLLILQTLVVILFASGRVTVNLAIWRFFIQYKILSVLLAALNVVTFVVYGIDKYRAVKEKSRVPIVTLLLLAAFGGSIGAWIAMYLFRHKTQKSYFTFGIPLILLTQLALILFIMNI